MAGKKSPHKERLQREWNSAELYQPVKEEPTSMLLKLLHEIEKQGSLLKSLYHRQCHPAIKTEKGHNKKKSYRPVSLMNLNTNSHKKTVANQSHDQIEKAIHHDQVVFIPGMQG